jgi:tryptophan halogenase
MQPVHQRRRSRRELLARLDGKALGDPEIPALSPPAVASSWNRNCRRHRPGSGFLEPLESTSIYLIQIAITTLLDYMTENSGMNETRPARASIRASSMPSTAGSRWNTTVCATFLILHYHATERDDAPIWNYCRTMRVPDSLVHKMDLFRRRARVVTYKDGLFLEPSWVAVYLGQR